MSAILQIQPDDCRLPVLPPDVRSILIEDDVGTCIKYACLYR
jgi:hypothetical protein